ncbi:hypothetical protein Ga0123462_1231 [Mariprofundus ferrinatatus]|uniref:Uncharacterized protein n=1 Tax=Mariprofundus ferrinatatus TaxID=1921087 RepID=A0A2K8L444_9PROT|nr:hypothetical protein [Mariprofundus ferrinatatus]ATX82095.1 hypothetical protein Ga0123462_1231 [Mariprofundus ferrinatatus]
MNRERTIPVIIALLAGLLAMNPIPAHADRDGRSHERDIRGERQHQPRHAERPVRQREALNRSARSESRERGNRNINEQQKQRRNIQTGQRTAREHGPAVRKHVEHNPRNSVAPRNQKLLYQQRQAHRASATHSRADRNLHVKRTIQVQKPYYAGHYIGHHPPRSRWYRGIHVHRPFGHLYPGFGFYYSDSDAFRWLAFTTISLAIVDHLDQHQQRLHEHALITATTARPGERVYWRHGSAYGSVTVIHIGYDRHGHEFREFKQSITRYGRTETSYHRAILRSDRSWDVVHL